MADKALDIHAGIAEIVERYQYILSTHGVEGLRKELQEQRTAWTSTKVNVAITGNTGSGKSKFINVMLGLGEQQEAKSGVVETTKDIQPFSSPRCPNVILFDLPGVGTNRCPKATYLQTIDIDKYDFFVIVACERFTENDTWLATEIKKRGKLFFFVRTHIDEDVRDHRKAHPRTHRPEEVVTKIRENCEKNLQNFETHIFLIDSFATDKFDFKALVDTLLEDSAALKTRLLAMSLAPATNKVLNMKLKYLIQRLLSKTPEIGVMNVEELKAFVKEEIAYYRKVFCIDEETLKRNHKLFNLTRLASDLTIKELDATSRQFDEICGLKVNALKELYKVLLEGRSDMSNAVSTAAATLTCLSVILCALFVTALSLSKHLPFVVAEKCSEQDTEN